MAGPRRPDLDAEGRALWKRVTATVRPLRPDHGRVPLSKTDLIDPAPGTPEPTKRLRTSSAPRPTPITPPVKAQHPPSDTLDGGWDRRIRRGMTDPDRTIDLHGHTLLSAHNALDRELDRAVADGVRVLLVVTGKPPREQDFGADGRPKRGAIRAAMGDWLGSSRHAARIAAVRNAHPRHGGTGALYVIMRRERETR
jgi:DNA-nicking Smr family endonuclease